MATDHINITVGQIMTSPAITVGPDATLIEAAKIMVSHRIGCLPVVNDELQVLGIITERSFFPSEKNCHLPTRIWPGFLESG